MFKFHPVLFSERNARSYRQEEVLQWAKDTFGQIASIPRERARRFLEESIEFIQAAGMSRQDALDILDYVFREKTPGNLHDEAGGVAVTLMALCEFHGVKLAEAEADELVRIGNRSPEEWSKRHQAKVDLGVAE